MERPLERVGIILNIKELMKPNVKCIAKKKALQRNAFFYKADNY